MDRFALAPSGMVSKLNSGNAIVRLRMAKGWNQAEFAKRLGTTPQNLGRYEHDESSPKFRKLGRPMATKMAKVLGCSLYDLIEPETTRFDISQYVNVFDVADTRKPTLQMDAEFLDVLFPKETKKRLRTFKVDDPIPSLNIERGDVLIVDLDESIPSKPGIYLLTIGSTQQPRYIAPTLGGKLTVKSNDADIANETVDLNDLNVIGRVSLKLTHL